MGLLFLQEVASKLCLGKQACLEPKPKGSSIWNRSAEHVHYPGSLEQGDTQVSFNCFERFSSAPPTCPGLLPCSPQQKAAQMHKEVCIKLGKALPIVLPLGF